MQAVILAAGLGSRIRSFHALPKGFIQLGNQTIIEESIQKLKNNGIHDIVIITGYDAARYDALSTEKKIDTIFNPYFATSGSLYSLYCASSWLKEDFIILESDIIYESCVISDLLSSHHANAIVLSGQTNATDEVYVQAKNKKLIRMSKEKNNLEIDDIYGEFVGISKLSLRDFKQLIHQLEQNTALLHSGHYDEQGIVEMTAFTDVFCLKNETLLWSEIDNEAQYHHAKSIYSLIENEK